MSVVRPSSPRAKYLHTIVVKIKSQRLNLEHFLLNPAQVSNSRVWRAPKSQEALWHHFTVFAIKYQGILTVQRTTLVGLM